MIWAAVGGRRLLPATGSHRRGKSAWSRATRRTPGAAPAARRRLPPADGSQRRSRPLPGTAEHHIDVAQGRVKNIRGETHAKGDEAACWNDITVVGARFRTALCRVGVRRRTLSGSGPARFRGRVRRPGSDRGLRSRPSHPRPSGTPCCGPDRAAENPRHFRRRCSPHGPSSRNARLRTDPSDARP